MVTCTHCDADRDFRTYGRGSNASVSCGWSYVAMCIPCAVESGGVRIDDPCKEAQERIERARQAKQWRDSTIQGIKSQYEEKKKRIVNE